MSIEPTFNEYKAKIILKKIEEGSGKIEAAHHAGISYDLLDKWLKKGEKGEDPVLQKFYEDFLRASASFVSKTREKAVDIAIKKGEVNFLWKLLQARAPEDYKTTTNVNLNKNNIVEADLFNKKKMSRNADEVYRERAKRTEKQEE